MNNKFNNLFKIIVEEFGITFTNNRNITPAITVAIINALNDLWDYRYENHIFDNIEPQSPDDELFDKKQPFKNLNYMQKWDQAIRNNESVQLLVSPMHFYHAVVNAITDIDERDKTIYINPEIKFYDNQQKDQVVANAFINLENNLNSNMYIFKIQPEIHQI